MSELFSAISIKNSRVLCVGGVTSKEAREAAASGLEVDPASYYLYLASEEDPSSPIEILARFFSADQAERAAELFPVSA
jgi:hypothetical protein